MIVKPCPFCGGLHIEFTTFDFQESYTQDNEKGAMQCQDCSAMGGVQDIYIQYELGRRLNDYDAIKNKSIEGWNRRI